LRRILLAAVLALSTGTLVGCAEEMPTATDGDLLPVDVVTLEVSIPFAEFGRDLQRFGGFGTPYGLPAIVVARDYQGGLEARGLVRWAAVPKSMSVVDSTGANRPDTSLTFLSGQIVAVVDTVASVFDGSVTLVAGALQDSWHPPTATWERAVDTVGAQIPWTSPGGGPVEPMGTGEWTLEGGDTAYIDLDSAKLALWTDSAATSTGLRLETETVGARMAILGAQLRLSVKPSSNPDTVVELGVRSDGSTFVYDPPPVPSDSGIVIGGAPAWRTVFQVELPEFIDGPSQLCAKVGCPYELDADAVSFAALVLTTETAPPAYQPTDSVRLDVRTVLSPGALPKSPLGEAMAGVLGYALPAEYFGASAGVEVSIPITGYVQSLIRGESATGSSVPSTIALLSVLEPSTLELATFEGSGGTHPPYLKLVLTIGDRIQIS
jgi:hypothetical protein